MSKYKAYNESDYKKTQFIKMKCCICDDYLGLIGCNKSIEFYEKDSTNHYPTVTHMIINKDNFEEIK